MYWLVSTLVNLVRNSEPEQTALLWEEQVALTIFFVLGLAATHLYRAFVKAQQWVSLPVPKLIKRLLFSVLTMSMSISAIYLGILWWLGTIQPGNFEGNLLVIRLLTNTSLVISLWIAIYFSVQYFQNYRKAELAALRQEAMIKEATLNKLRSQLNPHFVFNSLNGIRALVAVDPDKAREAITALANIFRKTLQLDKQVEVSFREEMQIVEEYLQLEKIRFEERLSYSFDIQPAVYALKIPPLMLQTLVENGIKHGISKLAKGGAISLKAHCQNGITIIEIRNPGQITASTDREGYGLVNTRQRLQLLYGSGATIELTESDESVLTMLRIPNCA